jgi:phosphate starvation-inducible PhoH-like protein
LTYILKFDSSYKEKRGYKRYQYIKKNNPILMSKQRAEVKGQIQEGIQDFEYKKNLRKKNSLTKEEFQKSNVHLSEKQQNLYKGIRNSTLTVVHGPAGTSKTYTTCYAALALLADKKIEKIIITKPIQESGENLGFLPGSMEDKLHPYKQSYYTTFCKILGRATVDMLFATEEIVFEPLAYMRGSTYDNCIMLLDECQNASIKQLMLWVTRLGKDSKAVMMGDTSQYDVRKKDSGYNDFIGMVAGMEELCMFEFNNTDIVRNKFLIQIADRYDKYRSEQKDI